MWRRGRFGGRSRLFLYWCAAQSWGCSDAEVVSPNPPDPPEVPSEAPGRPSQNHAPEILGLNVPDSAVPGDTIVVSVDAADADGDELFYQWEALGFYFNGTPSVEVLEDAEQGRATFTFQKTALRVEVCVAVRDPFGATALSPNATVDRERHVVLLTRGDGTVTEVNDLYDPVLLRNEEITVELDVDDYDYRLEDLVGAGWSALCDQEGLLHITAAPTPLGDARLTLTAQDEQWDLSLSVMNQRPVIDDIVLLEPVGVGEVATLEIVAHDPDGDALYYALESVDWDSGFYAGSGAPGLVPTFLLPTEIGSTFEVWVSVTDSYGSRETQTVNYGTPPGEDAG